MQKVPSKSDNTALKRRMILHDNKKQSGKKEKHKPEKYVRNESN